MVGRCGSRSGYDKFRSVSPAAALDVEASLRDGTLTINGLSKACAMTEGRVIADLLASINPALHSKHLYLDPVRA